MLEGISVSWPRDIGFGDSIFQERASFVGYPTADGSSGSFFYPEGTILAMSSTCRNKDAAWDYIRTLITPRLRKTRTFRFIDMPVNLHDYEVICWYELYYMADTIRLFPDSPLEHYLTEQHFQYGPEIYLMEILTEEDLQRHRELIDHTTRLYWPEDDLSNIVWETLGAYFYGDRTMDDTIRLIENRVGLYLNEQR